MIRVVPADRTHTSSPQPRDVASSVVRDFVRYSISSTKPAAASVRTDTRPPAVSFDNSQQNSSPQMTPCVLGCVVPPKR